MKQIYASQIQERKKRNKGGGMERNTREKEGQPETEQRAGKEERDSRLTLLYFHSLLKMWKNTIAVHLQQPTAYKPMSEESCQTVFHTEYSDLLSHRPAVQCIALQTVLLWKKLVLPMCKLLYQEGDKLGNSYCPYTQRGGAEQSAFLSPVWIFYLKNTFLASQLSN